jgi:methylated-DNA-[protein]-cysteine S-methyltransferase
MHTQAYRAIGQALRVNPYAPRVPCHRVVASDGTIGGFMGETKGVNIQNKIALLKKEKIDIIHKKIRNFDAALYKFQ